MEAKIMSKVFRLDKEALIKALDEAKKTKKRNFKQSIELIVAIEGLDLKKPENRIRGVVKLPHSTGKDKKIAMFADGAMADKAKEAGVDEVISSKELDDVSGSRRDAKKLAKKYDFFLSEPRLMAKVGKVLGFTLGPRGKMPQIVTPATDIASLVQDLRSSVNINVRNNPMVAVAIGNEDMDNEELADNALAVIEFVRNKVSDKARIKKVYVKTTMGKPVKVM
jgi:large subunit ribosomal protein L1